MRVAKSAAFGADLDGIYARCKGFTHEALDEMITELDLFTLRSNKGVVVKEAERRIDYLLMIKAERVSKVEMK